jgi:multiple sugar transport system permease protein
VAGIGFATPALLLLILTNPGAAGRARRAELHRLRARRRCFLFRRLKNFAHAMQDPVIRRSLSNTFLYVAIVVPIGVLLAMLIAILVHRRTKSRSFYEVIYFLRSRRH